MNKKKKNPYGRWLICTIFATILLLLAPAVVIVIVDPVFHYHAPIKGLSYPFFNDRYQNDGISRHFTYEGIIIGTSMTQNFKTTEAEALFNKTFIKLCYPGGHFKEINESLQRAYTSKNHIEYVIRCLDTTYFLEDKDTFREDYEYPVYLTNDNPLDDIKYLFNKAMFSKVFDVLNYTKSGENANFDDFGNWSDSAVYGKTAVIGNKKYEVLRDGGSKLTEDEKKMIRENIRQNVTDLISAHPETVFYLYIPPYSIVFWSELYQSGNMDRVLEAEEIVLNELLEFENVKVFSFIDSEEIVCNLDNYKDENHYGGWVNTWILEQLSAEEHRITKENLQEYINNRTRFFATYPYQELYN